MKGTVRIISGKLKGRAIPFVNSRFADADITPQKVKGALFSMLGESLDGLVFLDLYAGSGQVGIEALSRNCSFVIFNEFDRKRYAFIKEFLENVCETGEYLALNMKARSALKVLGEKGVKPDIVFLDPPYDKNSMGGSVYSLLLETLSEPGLVTDDTVVVVQHFSRNVLPPAVGMFCKKFTRAYGTTSLTLYESVANAGSADPADLHVGE